MPQKLRNGLKNSWTFENKKLRYILYVRSLRIFGAILSELECLRKRYYDFQITRNENEKIVVFFLGI